MVAALCGYILIFPGLIIHIVSIFDAARAAREENASGGR